MIIYFAHESNKFIKIFNLINNKSILSYYLYIYLKNNSENQFLYINIAYQKIYLLILYY